jgi:TatD DNase family protein
MRLIDTHSHIYLGDFDKDIDEVISRAVSAGVDTIFLPNIDSESIERVHTLTNRFPLQCIPLMGLHPTSVKADYDEELNKIFTQFDRFKYKGIGEIGIDLYWDKSFLEQQVIVFEKQLHYALEHSLPVVIHARDSFNEIFKCLSKPEFLGVKGIFHAFTGSLELAQWIVDRGFLLGIGGVVTFKNAKLPEVIKVVGLDHIVLETDAPYLTPAPFRGSRNESSYIRIIAGKIAEIKQTSVDEVARITTRNALQIFGL